MNAMSKKKSQPAKNGFLSVPDVQNFLGIKSRKTILKYIQSGKLTAYKIGGTRWRISWDDVKSFLKNSQPARSGHSVHSALAEVTV